MIKCESDKSANGLTKIEEQEEIENDDQDTEKDYDNQKKDNDGKMKDENCNDFDPLTYAIEFFSNYNTDKNQFCIKPSISSQGWIIS